MRHTLLFCATAVSLLVAVVTGSQQPTSGALSTALRAQLQNGKFQIVTSVRGLPLGVRDRMTTMFGGALDIAEPGTAFQTTDLVVTPRLPIRRMVAAGCSNEFYCLVYYERGGIAHTWHVALFHWSPEATRFEWGGDAPGGLKTIDAVRKAILSGVIKGHNGPW